MSTVWGNHIFYAVNPDGSKKWEFPTDARSNASIAADGTIYLGSFDGNLYALYPNGGLKWTFPIGAVVRLSSIAADGTVYASSQDGFLYAVTPSGGLKWKFHTGGDAGQTAIDSDGTIYIGSSNAKLYALFPNGTKKWEFQIELDPSVSYGYPSAVMGSDGTLYVGNYDGSRYLYALNRNDGSEIWRFQASQIHNSTPAVGDDGTIYFQTYQSIVYAVKPDGTEKWKWEGAMGNHGSCAPTIGLDGTLYVGSWDGNLYAFYTSSTGLAKSPWPMIHHDVRHTARAEYLKVTIDIKPGEEPNSINLGSNGNVPVAIFSTEEFDATQVDAVTVALAGATVKLKGKADMFMTSEEDLNGDGLMDLLVHIDTTALTLSASDTEAVLTGETYDGVCIRGTETVRIVPQ